ncbi:1050_t:CDS:2, partial [Gigaspora margarita]
SDATLENLLQPCSGTFKLSIGLPLDLSISIVSTEPSETEDSLNPEVQSTRGHPVDAKNHLQSSTKRDLSTFELIMSRKYNRKY